LDLLKSDPSAGAGSAAVEATESSEATPMETEA
jgi:hypothetical protein